MATIGLSRTNVVRRISSACSTRHTPFFAPLRTHSTSKPSAFSSSVNPDEVSHFNALASAWWDPHGSSRLLHLMNPMRHDFIRQCHATDPTPISRPQSLTYLDIGCGGGIFAESAARLASTKSVTAIDPSKEVFAVAKAHARRDPGLSSKLQYLNIGLEDLRSTTARDGDRAMPAQFDVVALWEVIEHVNDAPTFLDQVCDNVKPGGWLVMSTIARHWVSYVTTKLMAEDVAGIVPRGTHNWDKYINVDEMRAFFEQKGWFGGAVVSGVVYVPGLGWREVTGSERVGNYFFGVRKED